MPQADVGMLFGIRTAQEGCNVPQTLVFFQAAVHYADGGYTKRPTTYW
jgi:hypothetical protein